MQIALTLERVRLRKVIQPFNPCFRASTLPGAAFSGSTGDRVPSLVGGSCSPQVEVALNKNCCGKGLERGHGMFKDMTRVS